MPTQYFIVCFTVIVLLCYIAGTVSFIAVTIKRIDSTCLPKVNWMPSPRN